MKTINEKFDKILKDFYNKQIESLVKEMIGEEYKWEAIYLPSGEDDNERHLFKTKKEADKFLDDRMFNCGVHTGKTGKERCPSCDAEWDIDEYKEFKDFHS